jgi:hypothetical protein
MEKFRGQGTIEYLIIIAIIVVIGLVVTSILSNYLNYSEQISGTTQTINLITQNLAINEILINPNGKLFLETRLTESETTTINQIIVDDFNRSYNSNNTTNFNRSAFFEINTKKNCVPGEKVVLNNVTISSTTQKGLLKNFFSIK